MAAGCLYFPPGVSGPNTRVIDSSAEAGSHNVTNTTMHNKRMKHFE
jgi:hypothetical protein